MSLCAFAYPLFYLTLATQAIVNEWTREGATRPWRAAIGFTIALSLATGMVMQLTAKQSIENDPAAVPRLETDNMSVDVLSWSVAVTTALINVPFLFRVLKTSLFQCCFPRQFMQDAPFVPSEVNADEMRQPLLGEGSDAGQASRPQRRTRYATSFCSWLSGCFGGRTDDLGAEDEASVVR